MSLSLFIYEMGVHEALVSKHDVRFNGLSMAPGTG